MGTAKQGSTVSRSSLSARLVWDAPRRGGRLRDLQHRWTLEEAEGLGLTGRGGLASFARALLDGDEREAARLLGSRLPDPLDHVLCQPDLTVVATGPLQRELARELALTADVESTGGATVFRVTETSVRRRPARAVPLPLAHAGAPVADLPHRRRRPPARPNAGGHGGFLSAL